MYIDLVADTCRECGGAVIYAHQLCRRCYQRWYQRERRRLAKPYLALWDSAKDGHKICRRCETELPATDFSPRAAGKDGLSSWCRSCTAARKKARRAADPNAREREREYEARPAVRKRIRALNAATAYGITPTEYENLSRLQDGRCAVCQRTRKLAVDHCHRTGRVRELLCYPCNIALGQVNDNVELLQQLGEYVTRHRLKD